METEPRFESGMELSLELNGQAYRTALRGWRRSQYLMVDLPDAGQWPPQSKEVIIGRLFGNGTYYGFSTECMSVMREFRLVILRYPEDMVDTTYRKTERFAISLPVTVHRQLSGGERQEKGVITNISAGGCQLRSPKPIGKGDSFRLTINLPTGQTIKEVNCLSRSVNPETDHFVVGLSFDIQKDGELDPLAAFLETASKYQ